MNESLNRLRLVPAGLPPTPSARRRLRSLTFRLVGLLGLALWFLATWSAQAVDKIYDGPDGTVNAVAVGADGTVYVGGSFTSAGPQTGQGAVVDTTTGAVNRSFPRVTGSYVWTSVPDGSGGWYIGGPFTAVDGLARNNLAQIDSTGAVTDWNPNANGDVYTIAVSGSTVYVGGQFTTIGGITRNRLAAIGTDGTLSSWDPNASSIVQTLALSGSTVYVGGSFTTIGGTSRNRLAAIGTDGTLTSWDPNASGTVQTLAISGSTIYAGGSFTTIGGTTRNRLAAIGTDGTLSSWDPNASSNVQTLAISGSTIYAGGSFTTIGGTTRNRLAAIGTDGTLASWDPNVGSSVYGVTVVGSTVYFGGGFTTVGGTTRNNFAAVGTDGTLASWNPNANSGSIGLTISVSGGSMYVGGLMRSLGSSTRNRLAAIGTDGRLTSWDPNANGTVSALAISGSTVYAGGSFTTLGGSTTRNRLAAIGTDGTLSSWDPNAGSTVNALAISGSTVYAGGSFTTMGGSTRNRLAAIGTDGTLSSWDPNASSTVSSLAVSGGTIYAGGSFTTMGGSTTRNRLAAIGTDGTLSSWNPNANGTVNALFISGGTVYAGGSFTTLGGSTTRNRLAAIGTDGTLSSWDPNAASTVSSLAVSGATVYAGGSFSLITSQQKSISPGISLAFLNVAAPAVINVSSTSANRAYRAGEVIAVTVEFGSAVTVTGTPQVILETGATDRTVSYASGSGTTTLTFNYTVQAGDNSSDLDYQGTSALSLNGGTIADSLGVDAILTLPTPGAAGSLAANKSLIVDTTAPTLNSVSGPGDGTSRIGQNLSFTVNFSEAVTVTTTGGTPSFPLTIGASPVNADYVSGSGTSALVFRYTVQAGDADSDGIASATPIALNSGTIQDAAGNDAPLAFTPPTTTGVLVDAVAPTISGVTGPSAGSYKAGQNLDFTVNFDEAVTVNTTGGTPTIPLTVGASSVNASYVSGTGSSALLFRYAVQGGDTDADGIASASPIALNTGTIQDAAGNDATLTFTPPTTTSVLADTTAPTLASATPADDATGVLAGANIVLTFSENVARGTGSITLDAATDVVIDVTDTGLVTISGNTVTINPSANLEYSTAYDVLIPATAFTDAAGNAFAGISVAGTLNFTTAAQDLTAPTVTSITGVTDGTYGEGQVLNFTVNFSEDVTLTGTDSALGLTLGSTARTATYVSKTANSVTYTYTIQSGDSAPIGIYVGVIVLNSSTLTDVAGNAATLTQAGSLDFRRSLLVSTGISFPAGLRVDPTSGNVFVASVNNNSIKKYSSDGTLLLSFTTGLNKPYGFAVDGSGNYYVANTFGNSVIKFDSSGVSQGAITLSGVTPSTFNRPFSVSIDGSGNLMVADYNNNRVLVMQTDGAFLRTIGSGLNKPTGVLVDGTGNIYVTDSGSSTLKAYRSDGTLIRSTTGLNTPYGLALDGAGNIVVANNGSTTIAVYTASGLFQRSFNVSYNGFPDAATGVAVDAAGNVLASNGEDANIQLWSRLFPVTAFVDTTPPTIASVTGPSNGSYKAGQNLDFTVNLGEAATVDTSGGNPTLPLTIGSASVNASYVSGSGGTALLFRYTVQAGDTDADGIASASPIALNSGTIRDGGGNSLTLTFTPPTTTGVLVDTTAPSISSVSGPTDGLYKPGQNLDFAFNFDEAVTVNTSGGTPTIPVTIGAASVNASYASGSGTSALVFRYTVQAGETDADGIAATSPIALNSGTILDAAGNEATLTFTPPSTTGVLVDTTAPTIGSVTGPADGNYKAAQNLDFTVNFSEAVTVNTSGGTPIIPLTIGASSVDATYLSGSGTTALVFRYTIQGGDSDSDGIAATSPIALNSGTILDAAGNEATLTFTAPGTTGVFVDTTAPTISSVTGPADGSYKAAQNLDFTANFSEAVTVNTSGGTPSVPLTIGASSVDATYLSGSGTTALVFRYTVQAGDTDADGIASASPVALNSGTIRDGAGNDAALTFTAPTTTGVIVDTTAPTISSVTGPADGSYKAAQNLDFTVNFNEAVTVNTSGGTPTIPLTIGASSVNAGYLSGSGSTALVFRYTVQAGDTDADGITSASPIALNSGTILDAAGNEATLTFTAPTTTGLLVDTTAPTISNVTGPADGIYKAAQNLDFTVNFSEAVTVNTSGGTPSIPLTIGTSSFSAGYLSGSGTSALVFRYTVQAGDTDADGIASTSPIVLNSGTILDAAGNEVTLTFTAPTTTGVVVDTTAPTISSVSGPADGTYKAAQNLDFTVNFSEAVTVDTSGGTPTIPLTIGTSSVSAGYLSGSGSTALVFRYAVQAGDTDADGITSASPIALNSGTLRDAAGNDVILTFTAPATTGVLVDTTAPTVTGVSASSANGTYRAFSTINLQVSFSEAVTVTGTPQLTLETGATDRVVNYTSGSGGSTLVFSYTVASGDESADLDYVSTTALALNGGSIRDGVGNDATLTLANPGSAGSLGANKDLVVDGIAPTVVSINRKTPGTQYVAANTVVFEVTFSEPVSKVGTGSFAVAAVGVSTVTGQVTSVSGGPRIYEVTVQLTGGTGEFRLNAVATVN